MAWGDNRSEQLGDGKTEEQQEYSAVPVPVSGLNGVVAISSSAWSEDTLAVLAGGTAVGWGENRHGELGNGTTVSSDVPVPVSGLTGVKSVSAGSAYSLALLEDGTVMAWGSGEELGDGSSTGPEFCPREAGEPEPPRARASRCR